MTGYEPFRDDTPEIRALHAAANDGAIPRATFLAAVSAQRDAVHWRAWASFWLLAYGVVLLLAGAIFFFAYNWAAMHRFEKFALIEIALATCALLAWRRGVHTPVGRALLIGAAALTGALMAVFGQTYQTGADAWELFRGWALLILPWVLIADSAALWVMWLVIADAAILLFSRQSLRAELWPVMMFAAGMLPLALLIARDVVLHARRWLRNAWLRPLLLTATLALLTLPVLGAMFDDVHFGAIWVLCWIAVVAGGYVLYRFRRPDMIALTLIVFDAVFVLLAFCAEWMFEADVDVALQLYALLILAVVGGAYQWLRRESMRIRTTREVQHA